jgi:hypothetical protein
VDLISSVSRYIFSRIISLLEKVLIVRIHCQAFGVSQLLTVDPAASFHPGLLSIASKVVLVSIHYPIS